MVTKKYKKNQDNSPSGQSARLEQTITALHQERTKLKDSINEINRLENVLHYHDTKMMNVLGLQITCDAASLHNDDGNDDGNDDNNRNNNDVFSRDNDVTSRDDASALMPNNNFATPV